MTQNQNIIIVAEFNGTDRNPNTKGAGRLLEISRLDDGRTRVRVTGTPFITNDPSIVICDETLDAAGAELILSSLPTFTRIVADRREVRS